MIENGSPSLFYKTFGVNDNVTSVVIPVNEEYYEIKNGTKTKKKVWIENETKDFKQKISDSGYTKKIKQNILKIYAGIGTEVFGNSRVVELGSDSNFLFKKDGARTENYRSCRRNGER